MEQFQIIISRSRQYVDKSCDNPAMLIYFDPVNLDLPFFHIGYKIKVYATFVFASALIV